MDYKIANHMSVNALKIAIKNKNTLIRKPYIIPIEAFSIALKNMCILQKKTK